ncbi:hypothetical protein ERJ75_001782700 [Trypanosoma vivax]|nr:hypothetical protein ERJ75_001782700 [Trypanosoma vivax]
MGIARVRLFDRRVDREGQPQDDGKKTMRLDKRLGGSLVISRERRRAAGQCGLRQCCGKGEHGRLVTTEETGPQNQKRKALGWAKGKRGN